MSFGAFAGGLAQGINAGISQSKNLREMIKAGQLQKLRQQGVEEATQARNAATNELVKEVGIPETAAEAPKAETSIATQPSAAQAFPIPDPNAPESAQPSASAPPASDMTGIPASGIPPTAEAPKEEAPKSLPGRFTVGDKRFETKEEALKFASGQVAPLEEFQMDKLVPKMKEFYLSQGDAKSAAEFEAYAELSSTKKSMKTWANAYRAAMTGDYEKAAENIFKLYKSYNDGITPMSYKVVKDDKGNTTGFNVKLKNDKSGDEYEQFIDPKTLSRLGITALSPPEMFKMDREERAAADKQRNEIAKEDRKFGREVKMEGIKQGNVIEKVTIQEQLRRAGATNTVQNQINAKVNALKGAGYSDAFINEALPGIVGIGDYKKKTSPEEAKRLALSDRMKSDPTFSRKTPAQQQAIIDQDMKLIYGGVSPTGGNAPSGAGLPTQAAPSPKKGVPVWDNKEKKMIYR